ncbi:hypothetical protein BU16DRAFT_521146 [Lophium mytilinum]|uniref:Aminoglycoside phosphotransferase domain-containing protein n=1 Tax=Lophium mytilinum TaxID=390894 RepID=A0A6A6RC36_9PEZI|nr:hypothetical protein BU16DRAFT_521146 [Lophium mytilinum]
MEYVREHTSIPIPEVYAFDSDMRNNALGLEWIFMQKAPGEQWKTAQRHLKAPKVRCVLKRLAGWVHELEGLMFNQIGSIYRQWDSTKDGYLTYKLGPVVDQHIFKAQTECNDSVSMGPYDSTGDYASALLTAQMRDLSGSSRAEARQLNVRMAATDNRVKVDEKERRQYEQEYDLKERKKRVVREINREEKSPNNDLNITRILWRNLYNHENLCAEDRFLELDMLVSDHKYVAYLAREVRDFVKAETDIFGVEPEENLTWEEHCQTSDEEEPATPQCASENNKNLDNAIQIGLEISRLIPLVFKNEKLEPNSTYLRHWDINDENLLVDENGAVTALLDWEQLTTLPFVRKRERFMLPTLIAQTASCEVDTKTQKADGQTFKKEMRRLDPEWKKEKRPSADEQKDTRLDDQQEIISMVMKLHHMGDPESAMATKAKLQKMCIYGKPAPIF